MSEKTKRLAALLSYYGAPLYGSTSIGKRVPMPERVLVDALVASHKESVFALVLPVVLWKLRTSLNLEFLRELALKRGESRSLGFFLDMTGTLGKSPKLCQQANSFRKVRMKQVYFFNEGTTSYGKKLAALRTPDVARKWNFLMNMTMDSFASSFQKAVV